MVLNTNSSIHQEGAERLGEPFRHLSAVVLPLVTVRKTFIYVLFSGKIIGLFFKTRCATVLYALIGTQVEIALFF